MRHLSPRPGGAKGAGPLSAVALLLACVFCAAAAAAEAPPKPPEKAAEPSRLFIRADRRDLDYERGIGIVVGNVRFMPPGSDSLIAADAGVIWFNRQEAYLEGNIRIYRTLGTPVKPGDFDVPRPGLSDRTGLEPEESLEKAGDMDNVIRAETKEVILIDTRVPVSEAERVYVNWAEGTGYLVRPTLRFAEAESVANWVVTAPSVEGIATYQIPVVDKDGKPTGKFERRSHYVLNNATFTSCTFKDPHTRFTSTSADWIDGDRATMSNVIFQAGEVPLVYVPYLYVDLEYAWPSFILAMGNSSRLGTFVSAAFEFRVAKDVTVSPTILATAERGMVYGLSGEYEFHQKEIRGAIDLLWIPSDGGHDELADTSRPRSGWPAGWPPALGPLPDELPLGTRSRYVARYWHQQEYPEHLEFDLEVQKFSDAGVYREFMEKEFKTQKDPETRAMVKYQRDNWAFFIHVKKRVNDFLTQTEYLPQLGFNLIAQPLGGGFLFTNDTELAHVTTRYGDVRRRIGQSSLDITRIWLDRDEFSRPTDLTLRQNDTDKLSGWRFDTANIVSRPFELSIFHIEPYVGWRGSWFEHGLDSRRGSYAGVTPPEGPALPPAVAAAPSRTGSLVRNQVLAGGRISTDFHRTYDVNESPLLRRMFPNGLRHIVVPQIHYTYESDPTVEPRRLPENDAVTEQNGLHRINFALRNRWQTKRTPEIERDPRAPLGGEWLRRRQAAEEAMKSDPVNVIDLDMDIDLFMNPARDNAHLRGTTERTWSNLRTDLTVRPSDKTTVFFDTEFAPEDAKLEVVSAGVRYQPRPDFSVSASNSYHFHDVSLVRLAADWDINPKWLLSFDVQQRIAGGGGAWDQAIELTRRFHEWQVTLGYQFDKGKDANVAVVRIGPSMAGIYRPSWLFQPRSVAAFYLAESAR